jgi:transcriptional regulator with XRE-family HTH domain
MAILVREIRTDLGLTQPQFAERLGISPRSVKKIEAGDSEVALTQTYDFIILLAGLAGRSAIELYGELGLRERLFATPKNSDNKRVWPFAEWPTRDPKVARAVTIAESARYDYANGDFPQAIAKYEAALMELAQPDSLLAAYIELFLGNVYEMTGKMKRAGEILTSARQKAKIIAKISKKAKDKESERAAEIIILRADVELLWVDWAHGEYTAIIQKILVDGINVFDQRAWRLGDFVIIPRVHRVLARAYQGLGSGDIAMITIGYAVFTANGLATSQHADKAFFLDYPKQYGFLWIIDQQLATQLDILIVNGKLEHAFTVFCQLHRNGRATTLVDLHNWFNADWQAYLRRQRSLGNLPTNASLQNYTYEQWDDEYRVSREHHIRALNMRAFALAERDAHSFEHAVKYLKEAKRLASQIEANYLYVLSTIELGTIYVQQQNKQLAKLALNDLEGNKTLLDNMHLKMLYDDCRSAVAQLDGD